MPDSPVDLRQQLEQCGQLAAKHVRSLRQQITAHGCPFHDVDLRLLWCMDCADKDQKAHLLTHAYGDTASYYAIDQSIAITLASPVIGDTWNVPKA